MATSLQCRQAAILVVASLSVLFIASADAGGCPSGYKGCNTNRPGCETCIRDDVNNCGDCRKKCRDLPYTAAKCENHKCVYTCKPGWADCDNNKNKNGCETNIFKDPNNCGGCLEKCQDFPYTTVSCSQNGCSYTCKPGRADCDRNLWQTGCETDSANDVNNCGACRNVCEVTLKGGEATCKNGQCGQQCKKGTTLDNHKYRCVPAY